jgi:hypothetical protein
MDPEPFAALLSRWLQERAGALPLAAALDLAAGERVRWQLLNRSDLRLIRLNPTPARKTVKKSMKR